MLAGVKTLATGLGITQITEIGFKAVLDAFNGAVSVYDLARSSQQAAYDVYHAALADMETWLTSARGSLLGNFGNRWSREWAQAGFVQPSTSIPVRLQDRVALVMKLGKFFTAHPEYEVPSKDLTAAGAIALRTSVVDAQNAVQSADMATQTANAALDTAQTALTKEMRMLISILSGLLSKNDARWEGFGLNRPGMDTTPAAPSGLRATVMGNQVLLECDVTPLATRYRFRGKILGVDQSYKLLKSASGPMAMLEGVAGGITLEIIVQAVNGPSQSVPSEPITLAMPAAAQPAELEPTVAKPVEAEPVINEEELAPLAAIVPNGSSNGNGNGSHALSRIG